jgi:hypothetical protein
VIIFPVGPHARTGLVRGQAAAPLDFDLAHRENLTNLQHFLQIETSNPPGNETKGALFLKAILGREGISSEIVERLPGRSNLTPGSRAAAKRSPSCSWATSTSSASSVRRDGRSLRRGD